MPRQIPNEQLDEYAKIFHDPVAFVRRAIGAKPQKWQRRVLRDLADPEVTRIAVKSCHGPGKTTVAAWAVLWWLFRYFKSKVPCTAPTEHQLYDNLWPEIHHWIDKSEMKLGRTAKWTRVIRTPEPPSEDVCGFGFDFERLS